MKTKLGDFIKHGPELDLNQGCHSYTPINDNQLQSFIGTEKLVKALLV